MKIDSTDIREFDAKQLSVEFTPPQTTVTVDMFEGALIPSESETYTPLSGITVAVMKNGEKVQCYGYYNDCNGVKWLYVVYKNIVGYASSKYLSK